MKALAAAPQRLIVLLLVGAGLAVPLPARAEAPSACMPRSAAPAASRYAAERAVLLEAGFQKDFPFLKDRFEVLAPSTEAYNCVSHTLGQHRSWIDPRTGPADNRFLYMDRLYNENGYRRLPSLDYTLAPGKRKIIIYAATENGSVRKITHAALQMPDGTWTSKLGKLSLVKHAAPAALAGPNYGKPVAVYVAGK